MKNNLALKIILIVLCVAAVTGGAIFTLAIINTDNAQETKSESQSVTSQNTDPEEEEEEDPNKDDADIVDEPQQEDPANFDLYTEPIYLYTSLDDVNSMSISDINAKILATNVDLEVKISGTKGKIVGSEPNEYLSFTASTGSSATSGTASKISYYFNNGTSYSITPSDNSFIYTVGNKTTTFRQKTDAIDRLILDINGMVK